jgi:hypothetical protein
MDQFLSILDARCVDNCPAGSQPFWRIIRRMAESLDGAMANTPPLLLGILTILSINTNNTNNTCFLSIPTMNTINTNNTNNTINANFTFHHLYLSILFSTTTGKLTLLEILGILSMLETLSIVLYYHHHLTFHISLHTSISCPAQLH